MRQLLLCITGAILFGLCCGAMAKAPPLGWTTQCRIVSIVDGDTIDVEVRLLGCWSPESRTTNEAEKKRGLAAKEHLRAMAEGCDATLFVPGGEHTKDLTTLGRVLGHVWLIRSDGKPDAESLSEMQVTAGHATRKRGK
jgi:endonuclease YncB( thermonuclease family)